MFLVENNYNCDLTEANGFITINEISFDHFNTSLLFWPNYEARIQLMCILMKI